MADPSKGMEIGNLSCPQIYTLEFTYLPTYLYSLMLIYLGTYHCMAGPLGE
jgi:hypothetical protein